MKPGLHCARISSRCLAAVAACAWVAARAADAPAPAPAAAAGGAAASVPAATNAVPLAERVETFADDVHFNSRLSGRLCAQTVQYDPDLVRLADALPGARLPANSQVFSDLRADLRASPFDFLDLGLKPCYLYSYRMWNQGVQDGNTGWKESGFIEGWLIQVHAWEQLALSYSRENVQWGPCSLASPSNPFRINQPVGQIEPPAMDFLRAIWTPTTHLSFSALANIDDGVINGPSFGSLGAFLPLGATEELEYHRAYALKADYTERDCNFSVIGSMRESQNGRVGGYASWNATDALLLRAETGVGTHGNVDYVVGASYTFDGSGTLAAEYYFNGKSPREDAAGPALLIAPFGPDAGYLNHDYTLLQYSQREMLGSLDVIARWVHGLDDQSDRVSGSVEYAASDHTTLTLGALADLGNHDQEFGMLFEYQVLAGLKYTM